MTLALREWAVTVRALAEGEQFVVLFDGSEQPAAVGQSRRFFLYPDFDPREGTLVRESQIPELRRALEDGAWESPVPTVRMFKAGLTLGEPRSVRLRAFAEITASFPIQRPDAIDVLSPFHVWTPDYAARRFVDRPLHGLSVLLLRAYRIPRPVTVHDVAVGDDGDRFVELARELPFEGTPVVSDSEFAAIHGAVAQRMAQVSTVV